MYTAAVMLSECILVKKKKTMMLDGIRLWLEIILGLNEHCSALTLYGAAHYLSHSSSRALLFISRLFTLNTCSVVSAELGANNSLNPWMGKHSLQVVSNDLHLKPCLSVAFNRLKLFVFI